MKEKALQKQGISEVSGNIVDSCPATEEHPEQK
jgi:hypothetical protein